MRWIRGHPLALLAALTALGPLTLAGCAGGGDASQPVSGLGTPVPTLSAAHIPVGQTFSAYNSNPPTSGTHWDTWARCGVYPRGLPNEQIVHNLEHGNVVVSYNLKDQGEADRLTQIAQRLPEWNQWGVLRFYTDMPEGQVAMTAWGVLDTMRGVDEARIGKFWEAYAHNRLSDETRRGGPIPCSQ